jgi:hypothetical protein
MKFLTLRRRDLSHAGRVRIAVSFHRLFLGGLLPSRARFRFAGSPPIRPHIKSAQSRVDSLSPISVCQHRGPVQ